MDLSVQRRLSAQIMKCGLDRVEFDPERADEIKESITKFDLRQLIKQGAIIKKQKKGVSRVRARKRAIQKKKHRRQGLGRRKGTKNARASEKTAWINKIRTQRTLLKSLRDNDKVTTQTYHNLYAKAKGGFFRSKRHLQFYIKEHNLLKK